MYHEGDKVIYNGAVFYVIEGPIRGSSGLIYTISTTPPPIHGVNESELTRP